jgi:hypothetical protein
MAANLRFEALGAALSKINCAAFAVKAKMMLL